MIGQLFRVFFRHDLEIQRPAGEIALFNVLVQIALMAVPVPTDERFGLGVRKVLDALLRLEVET